MDFMNAFPWRVAGIEIHADVRLGKIEERVATPLNPSLPHDGDVFRTPRNHRPNPVSFARAVDSVLASKAMSAIVP
jgi:hypothetical protein